MDKAFLTDYPRIYRPSITSRIVFIGLGILLIFQGIILISAQNSGAVANAISIVLSIIFAIAGVFIATLALISKITLYSDRVEQSLPFKTNTLLRTELLGYEIRTVKGKQYIDLLPKNQELKKITVPSVYRVDGAFDAWIKGLRDLGAEQQNAVDQAIMNDGSLGATPDERLARVRAIRAYTNYAMIGALIVIAVLCVFPHPRWLAISTPIICPWIAIVMIFLWGNNFTLIEIDKISSLRKANILPLIFLPVTSYYVLFKIPRNGMPVMPLDWHQLIIPSIVGGLTITLIIWVISQSRTINVARLTGMVMMPLTIYSGGTIAMANEFLDHHPVNNYTLTVQNKYQTTGKGAANYLHVASTDTSYHGYSTVKISFDLYRSIAAGSTICAHIHSGAFGMAWEKVGPCTD